MKGLLKAALAAGKAITVKKGKKKLKPTVAKPKVEYNRRSGKGLDAYSPSKKQRRRVPMPKGKG